MLQFTIQIRSTTHETSLLFFWLARVLMTENWPGNCLPTFQLFHDWPGSLPRTVLEFYTSGANGQSSADGIKREKKSTRLCLNSFYSDWFKIIWFSCLLKITKITWLESVQLNYRVKLGLAWRCIWVEYEFFSYREVCRTNFGALLGFESIKKICSDV